MKVSFNGGLFGNEGLCHLGRGIVEEVSKHHTLKIDMPSKVEGYWSKFYNTFEGPEDVYIMNGHVPHLPEIAKTHKNIISVTVFETALPKEWVDALNIPEVKQVWTISEFGKKLILESGVRKPVYVTYVGVDARYKSTDGSLFSKDKSFKFLNVSAPHALGMKDRKGLDILIRAFKEEFRDCPTVTLVLKINSIYADAYNRQLGKPFSIHNYIKKLIPEGGSVNNIAVLTDYLSVPELNNLYNSVHCGVFPARAECFGVPQAEMGTIGKPVITTAYSSTTEFADQRLAVKVKSMQPLDYNIYPYNDSVFAEPDISHLKSLMRQVYNDYEHEEFLAHERAKSYSRFAWEKLGLRMNEYLRKI